jgi:3alpha(or 20beta)-hydroxysteroid dehydrogenase
MRYNLVDQVILVTGTAGGVGSAIVNRLLADGARVAATDIRPRATPFDAPADRVRFSLQDVGDEQGWVDTIAATIAWAGKLTGLVNNAGYIKNDMLVDMTAEDLDQQYRVNQRGPALGMKHAAEAMARAGGGAIVNMSSLGGMRGFPTTGAYSAAKWALRGLTKVAAVEFGPLKIRVNSIHPGAVDTPLLSERGRERALAHTPLGMIAQPDDIAGVVAFLLSDDARYINGAEIAADGGLGA